MKDKKGLPAGRQGIFIVIDGTDGSGKATQTKLLIERIKKSGRKVDTIDFPQYEKNFFGQMVGRYLTGEFGTASAVSPYLASILFAADRFESKARVEGWLQQGHVVIADRYASSNQIHQGGKIYNEKDRKEFLAWLEKMEFSVFKIPKPEAIIYLDVPIEYSQKLLKNKAMVDKKSYLKGKKDIHESDKNHLIDAKESAMKIVKSSNNWIRINCVKKGKLMPVEEISEIVWNHASKLIT